MFNVEARSYCSSARGDVNDFSVERSIRASVPYPCGMFRKMFGILLFGAFMIGAPLMGSAQDGGISQKKQEKILAKKAKTDKKETAKREKADRKRHLSLQDKATRKRMKRNTKRADRGGSRTYKDGFFRRTFGL